MDVFGNNTDCCGEAGSTTLEVAADVAARDALVPEIGDQIFVASDGNQYIWDGTTWQTVDTAAALVSSVNTQTGVVALTTTDIPEGTNEYYTTAKFDARLATKTTGDLPEGSNQYYTQAKFDSAFAGKSTTDLAEGTNQYYTNARFDTQLATKTTDNLPQGATNKYYTAGNARADLIDNTTPTLTTVYSSTTSESKFAPIVHTHTSSQISDFKTSVEALIPPHEDTVVTSGDIADLQSTINANIAAKTTDDIKEGATNLYHTTARVDARVALVIDNTTPSISKAYSSNATDSKYSAIGHTHTASQITDFATAADARITIRRGIASGVAPLDADAKVPIENMPDALTSVQIDNGDPRSDRVWSSSKVADEIALSEARDITLTSADITDFASQVNLLKPIVSVAGKTSANILLYSSDIVNWNDAVDARVPVKKVAGKTGDDIKLFADDINGLDARIASENLNLIDDTKASGGTTYSSTYIGNNFEPKGVVRDSGDINETTNLFWTTARNQQLIDNTSSGSAVTTYSSSKSNATYAPLVHTHLANNITNFDTQVNSLIDAQKGVADGVCELGGDGKILTSQFPDDIFGSGSYGNMYSTAGTVGPLTPANTYFGVTSMVAGAVSNITFEDNATSDRLNIITTGTYAISVSVSCESDSKASDIDFTVFRNNVQTVLKKSRTFTDAGAIGSVSLYGILELTAGDFIDLRIAESTATSATVSGIQATVVVLSTVGARGNDGADGKDGVDASTVIDDDNPAFDGIFSSQHVEDTFSKIGHTHSVSALTDLSTTTVPEGSNLYFTTARNQALINDSVIDPGSTYSSTKIEALVTAAAGVTIDNDNSSDTNTYSSNYINSIVGIQSVAGRTDADILLDHNDISDFDVAVTALIPVVSTGVTSVNSKTGPAVVLDTTDLADFNTATDARITAKIIDGSASDGTVYSSDKTNATYATLSHSHVASNITDFDSASDARITLQKAQANGLATLDSGSKIPLAQLPAGAGVAIDDVTESKTSVYSSSRTNELIAASVTALDIIDNNAASPTTVYSSTTTDGRYAQPDGVIVANNLAMYTDTTGRLVKDSGLNYADIEVKGHTHAGTEVSYDNTTSGLSATNTQTAIDELDSVIDGHISDATLHRVINDFGTSTSELWSASKIASEIASVSVGVPIASQITVLKNGAANFDDVQDSITAFSSTGHLFGGDITDNGDGTINIGFIECALRDGTNSLSSVYFVNIPGINGITFVDDSTTYLYASWNSGSPTVATSLTPPPEYINYVLAKIYRNGTSLTIDETVRQFSGDGMRLINKRLGAETFKHTSGAILAASGTRNFTITAGEFWQGLTRIETTAYDSAVTTFTYYYRNGSGGWTRASANQINNVNYDNGSGTLANLTISYYATHWVYLGADDTVSVLHSQGQYTIVADALNANEPTKPPYLLVSKLIGKIVIQEDGSAMRVFSPFVEPTQNLTTKDNVDFASINLAGSTIYGANSVDIKNGASITYILSGSGELKAGFTPVSSTALCNKAYVDSVIAGSDPTFNTVGVPGYTIQSGSIVANEDANLQVTVSGTGQFICAQTPTTVNSLCNKAYVDSLVSGAYDQDLNTTDSPTFVTLNLLKGTANTLCGTGVFSAGLTGTSNTAFGNNIATNYNTSQNTYIGANCAQYRTSNGNTAMGFRCLRGLVGGGSTGGQNVGYGYDSGQYITTGSRNSTFGYGAATSLTTGSNNTVIGNGADCVNNLNNQTAIGNEAVCTEANTVVLGNSAVTSIRSMGNVDLGSASFKFKDLYLNGNVKLGAKTQLLEDALIPDGGDIIYNSNTQTVRCYNGNEWRHLTEPYMMTPVLVRNGDLYKSVYIRASSEDSATGINQAWKAVSGDTTGLSRWWQCDLARFTAGLANSSDTFVNAGTTTTNGPWLKIAFMERCKLANYRFCPRELSGDLPISWNVYLSDDNYTYRLVHQVINYPSSEDTLTDVFTLPIASSGTYFLIQITEVDGATATGIGALEFNVGLSSYGDLSTPVLTSNGIQYVDRYWATASSVFAVGYEAWRAVDGQTPFAAQWWSSSNAGVFSSGLATAVDTFSNGQGTISNGPWLQIGFPSVGLLNTYRFEPKNAATTYPVSWTIFTSLDGISFDVADERDDELQVANYYGPFTLAIPKPCRFFVIQVRKVAASGSGATGIACLEFNP